MLGREKIEPQRGSATQTITRVDCLVSKARDRARAEFFASRARGGARSPCLTRGGGLPKWITQPKAFAQPSAARHLPTAQPSAARHLPTRRPRAPARPARRREGRRSALLSSFFLFFLLRFFLLFALRSPALLLRARSRVVVVPLCESTTGERWSRTRLASSSSFSRRSRGRWSASCRLATRRVTYGSPGASCARRLLACTHRIAWRRP